MTRGLSSGSLRGLFDTVTRRQIALVLLAVVVLTAGCSSFIGDDSVDDSAPLDDIPAEADGIVHFQTAVLSDSVTESMMDGLDDMEAAEDASSADGPESWDDAVAEFEEETGIDPDDVHSMTMFAGGSTLEDGQEYSGVILKSDLDWEDFEEAAEEAADEEMNASDVEEDSYNGVTVYVEDDEFSDIDTWVADFGDGTFAMGPQPVVEDVIDTREGDAPGVDDDLRSTYEEATEGYLMAAFTLTDEQSDAAGDIAAEEAGIGEMFIPDAEAMTMSYHTEDDQLNAEMDLVLQSSEDANTFTSFVQPIVEQPSAGEDPAPDEQPFAWVSDQFSIESNDERVSMAFRATPDDLLTALDSLENADPFGSGPSGEFSLQPAVPSTAD